MSNAEILHAYRHLLRHGLHAVQFSVPARFVIQSQLRRAFRASPRPAREGGREAKDAFDPEAVRRTIWFLKAAAAEKGLEHRIVKNLVRVAWFREREGKENWKTTAQIWEDGGKSKKKEMAIRTTAYEHYEATIAMLNHSMGLCLPLR